LRRFLIPLALIVPLAVAAQEDRGLFGRIFGGGDETEEGGNGGGFLERQLENALSGAGREVTVTGFEGALSSRATLEELTIADDEGVWLTLRDVVLDWNRSALLRRRLDISELAAGEILLPRLPESEEEGPTVPSPEAQGFSLPELPVAVEIDSLDVAQMELGEPLFGEEAVISLSGEVALADGEGAADIRAERIDGSEGVISLAASFDNESEDLNIALDVREGEDGIVANLIDLPGRPSLELVVDGEGPLSDFSAEIALATDGAERLAGTVQLGRADEGRTFAVDLGGDIAPVFVPEYREFFGPEVGLVAAGSTLSGGGVRIDTLRLNADALSLEGQAAIGSDGLPDRIALAGQIASGEGAPVLLPLPGPPTRVGEVALDAQFDANEGEDWQLDLVATDIAREGFDAARVALEGTGRIAASPRRVTADLDFAAQSLSLADGGAQAALGEDVNGVAEIAWTEGEPVVIDLLTVDGESYGLEASGQVAFGEALSVEGEATASARDLSAFSGLAGRPLEGAVDVTLAGSGDPLAGQFDVTVDGETRNLAVGIAELDPLLDGEGTLRLVADRTETGTRIETLRVETPHLLVSGDGTLATGSSEIDVRATINDTSLIAASLEGPAELTVSADEVASGYAFDLGADASGARIAVDGTVDWLDLDPTVEARFEASIADLAAFSGLVDRQLAGSVEAEGDVRTSFDLARASLEAAVEASDVEFGDARIDELLAGTTEIDVDAVRSGETVLIRSARLNSADAQVIAEGRIEDLTGTPVFDGDLNVTSDDIAPFSGLAGRDLDGAISADASGRVATDLSRFDLALDLAATDLDPGVPGASEALAGRTVLAAEASRDGSRVEVDRLSLQNPQASLEGSGVVTGLDAAPAFDGTVSAEAPDLSVFSGLAGRELDGTLDARFEGEVATDLSVVDAILTARGRELDLGLPGPPLLPGEVALDVEAVREGDTVTLSQLSLDSGNLTAEGAGQLSGLSGTPVFDGRMALGAETIEPIGGFVGRPLAGSIEAEASGSFATDLSRFDVVADAEAAGLQIGQADIDRLLAGTTTVDIDASREDGVVTIRAAEFDAPGLVATATGTLGESGSQIDVSARLADIGPYAPDFSGPVSIDGTIAQQNGTITVDLDAEGPGGIGATVTGDIDPSQPVLDLSIEGQTPLAAANRFTQPRALSGQATFDVSVQGPPGLDAVSGTVRTSGARFVDPALGIVLEGIDLTANLDGSTIGFDGTATVNAGGSLAVDGSVGLTGNLPADISVALNGVVLQNPELYTTSITGDIGFVGPIRGGALISGELALGETEIRVPSTSAGAGGPIPEITHVGEPAAVRATRQRAGLLRQSLDGTESLNERRRTAHNLDIGIVANNRIFVRGRGLDAELGGSLRVRGTTTDVVPSGQFELVRGRLDILGQRLDLDEGSIRLQGDFVPFINLTAVTETGDVTVFVVVEGRISSPDIRFLSEPDLPEDEVLAQLLFGRSVDEISPLQAAQLASAVAQLAGGGPGLGDTLRQNLGLDDLDLTAGENGGAAVRAGKYLTDDIYTDVIVDSEGETQLNLNYEVTDSFTVKGGVDDEGGTSLGIFFERDY
jgi:translocation and assembly module TamB